MGFNPKWAKCIDNSKGAKCDSKCDLWNCFCYIFEGLESMKNVLTHDGTSQQLLANVDDGTNTLFINGDEIPSSSWVGTGNYTKVIGGTTITIAKVNALLGNIMLQQTGTNTYQLVTKGSAGSGNNLVWA